MSIVAGVIALALQAATATPPPPPPAPTSVATANTPTPMIVRRGEALVALMRGNGDYDTLFAPSFRTAIPKAQFDKLTAQVIAALGQPTGIEGVDARDFHHATLKIGFERGVMNAEIVIAGDAHSTLPDCCSGVPNPAGLALRRSTE